MLQERGVFRTEYPGQQTSAERSARPSTLRSTLRETLGLPAPPALPHDVAAVEDEVAAGIADPSPKIQVAA